LFFTIFIHPKNPDFHFKISGFSAAIKIKLADKSGYQDNGYPDLQTLVLLLLVLGMGVPVNLLTG